VIRALIVDDEPLARERIRHLLRGVSDVQVVGECRDGPAAVEAVRTAGPDLMFLDVQMPEMDGFEVLRLLEPGEIPAVVFVTAYDRYAIEAFEVRALDYLLKPFDRDRFLKTLQRVREHLRTRGGAGAGELHALLRDLPARPGRSERLVVRSGGRIVFLPVAEIDWIEAADNYVRLHAGKQVHVMRETLQRLESTLDPERFVRIHRSTMVNLERVRELQPWFHGEYVLILTDGTRLTTGRAHRARLDRWLRRQPGDAATERES
jgi:two-component system LytT family response regulator